MVLKLVFKNCRPVSNLAYVSKLVETAVAKQLQYLFPGPQSAYRLIESTEHALLRVTNGIFLNMNNQRVTLLLPLDLSTAFETVDLLSCIGSSFRLVSKENFSLSLSHICQQVFIDDIL